MTSDDMRMRVVGLALRHPRLILVLAGLLAIAGLMASSRLPIHLFPARPVHNVTVRIPAPGLAPKAVEQSVTRPVENRLQGMDGLVRLHSLSVQGLSSVTARFDADSDPGRDRRLVAERLAGITRDLPRGVGAPRMMPPLNPTGPARVAALTSSKRDVMAMRDLAVHLLRPRLLAVPGVAQVAIYGGGAKSYQIQVQPNRLIRFRIGFDQVIAAARRATGLAASGFLDTPNQRIILASHGQAGGIAGLAETVLRSGAGGAAVTLGDVAKVVAAPLPAESGAAIMGHPAVRIEIYRQPNADPASVDRHLSRVLAHLTPVLARDGVQLDPDVVNAAATLAGTFAGLGRAAAIGGLLVAVLIVLLLFDLAAAGVAMAAIVLSLLAASLILYGLGLGIDLMVAGGLIAAFGLVVGDALLGLVPLLRRLREGGAARAPAETVLAAWRDADGWGGSSLALLVTMAPLFALTGPAAPWVMPLVVTFAAAVAASLAISVTVAPVLAMKLVAGRKRREESWAFLRLIRRWRGAVRRLVERPRLAAFWVVLSVAILAIALALGTDSRPRPRLGPILVHMEALPGTSVAQSLRLGRQATAALNALPGVVTISQRVGRAPHGETPSGPWTSLFDVTLGRGDHAGMLSRVRAALAPIPGIRVSVGWALAERIDPPRTLTVTVTGDALGALDHTAERVAATLRKVPGIENPSLGFATAVPQMNIQLRPADLRRWGFRPVQVLDAVGAAFAGRVVGHIYRGDRAVPVLVQMANGADSPPASVAGLLLRDPVGSFVRLGQLADIVMGRGPAGIIHRDGRRVVEVTARIAGGNAAVAAAKAAIARKVKLPAGLSLSYGEKAPLTSGWLFPVGLAALAGLVALLAPVLGGRGLALVSALLPPALAGGAVAAAASGGLSPAAWVGLASVLALALRHGLLLLARYRRQIAVEGQDWDAAAAVRGAMENLGPLAAITLTTGLGLAPLLMEPMVSGTKAVLVILAGLATMMATILLVLPALTLRWGNPSKA